MELCDLDLYVSGITMARNKKEDPKTGLENGVVSQQLPLLASADPVNADSTSGTGANHNSIGVIGSSRPGSRVAGNHCEHGSLSLQSIQGKETSQLPKPDAQSTPLQDSGKRQFKPINMSPNFSSVPACQDGYTLGSSMWATPNSSASQFPFSQGIPNYLNLNSENKTSSPTSQIIKSGVQPSPEFLLGKQAQNSEFNSPALSFTQTGSAPSTGRSFFAPEGNGPPSKSFMTGFQAGSIDDAAKNAFASQAQAIE
ncbi:hypothetical protein BY996DRAFT_6413288, partial [Phakopsora pachyrhizi]